MMQGQCTVRGTWSGKERIAKKHQWQEQTHQSMPSFGAERAIVLERMKHLPFFYDSKDTAWGQADWRLGRASVTEYGVYIESWRCCRDEGMRARSAQAESNRERAVMKT
jgi:hypothetical protein